MSGITRKLFSILLNATTPMSHAELHVHFDGYPRTALSAVLSSKTATGDLVRTGRYRMYSYRLSDEMRARLEADGVDAVFREGSASGGRRPRSPEPAPAIELVQSQALREQSLGGHVGALTASVGTSPATLLPWLNEEEAPPCIGERWRDGLRPRPVDD